MAMAMPSSVSAASTRAAPAITMSPCSTPFSAPSLLRPRPPLQLQPSSSRSHHHPQPQHVSLLLVHRPSSDLRCRRRLMTAQGEVPQNNENEDQDDDEEQEEEEEEESASAGFDAAVALFNRGEFHACHDVVEELWYGAEDPARTLLHGILQCAVGFHHLFNQNHRGAMMELGEGLCKLRKLHLAEDHAEPFSAFRDEVAAVLQFLYCTQKELAACTDEFCLTMDGSPSSYQLLGNFAAGQQLYRLEVDADAASNIIFSASSSDRAPQAIPLRVKLPTLRATEQHLTRLQCTYEYM